MESLFPVSDIFADLKESIREATKGVDVFTHVLSFFHSIDWKVLKQK